jgi:hypothetical protein
MARANFVASACVRRPAMRIFALVLLLSTLPIGASAQTNEPDVSCKAPVSLNDKLCADVLDANVSGERLGSMEQRDDGYFVFVPRAKD